MGAGRKTKTLSMGDKFSLTPCANASVSARNLRPNDLGAVIFGCTHSTMKECLQSQLFGLPALHMSYVQNIRPGLPLFLFNYSDRKMHGIFEAASHGKLGINMYGWTDGSEKTPYPAQARVRLRKQCRALSEEQYHQILVDNYYDQSHHFWFELDHAQTGALLSLFESLPVPNVVNYNAPFRGTFHQSSTNKDRKISSFSESVPNWPSLFREKPNASSRNHNKKLKSILSETDRAQLDCGGMPKRYSLPVSISCDAPFQGTLHEICDNNDRRDEESLKSTLKSAFLDSEVKGSSFYKERANAESRSEDKKLKSMVSGTGCTQTNNGDVEEGFSRMISEWHQENEEIKITEEIHSDKEGMNSEEERIYLKLKLIALNRGSLSTFQEGHMEEAVAPCMTVEAHLEDGHSPEAPSISKEFDGEEGFAPCTTNEAYVVDEYSAEAPLIPKECDEDPVDSSNIHTVIDQLRGELEDLKSLATDQFRKASALEKKLACSDVELHRLRDHVQFLASQLNKVSTACVNTYGNGTLTEPSYEPQLGMEEMIFILGGCNGDGSWLLNADCYLTTRDIVRYMKPMRSTRSFSSAAVLNGYIFNLGGCADSSGSTFFDTVEIYDPWNDKWTSCPSLSEKKAFLASTTLHNKIYAFGGVGGGNCSSKVEMFDPGLGKWILIQSMLQKRHSAAAAELNGALYVVGGYDGNHLNSAERWDPREVSWCKLQRMNTKRGSHSLAVLNEKLYVVGGFEEIDKIVPSVEIFDPRMGSWVLDGEMKQPRGYCFAPVIGDTIYTVGGLKGRGVFADTVECYKEGRGWSVTNLKGLGERSYFSAALL